LAENPTDTDLALRTAKHSRQNAMTELRTTTHAVRITAPHYLPELCDAVERHHPGCAALSVCNRPSPIRVAEAFLNARLAGFGGLPTTSAFPLPEMLLARLRIGPVMVRSGIGELGNREGYYEGWDSARPRRATGHPLLVWIVAVNGVEGVAHSSLTSCQPMANAPLKIKVMVGKRS
jgi:hypothetical protein